MSFVLFQSSDLERYRGLLRVCPSLGLGVSSLGVFADRLRSMSLSYLSRLLRLLLSLDELLRSSGDALLCLLLSLASLWWNSLRKFCVPEVFDVLRTAGVSSCAVSIEVVAAEILKETAFWEVGASLLSASASSAAVSKSSKVTNVPCFCAKSLILLIFARAVAEHRSFRAFSLSISCLAARIDGECRLPVFAKRMRNRVMALRRLSPGRRLKFCSFLMVSSSVLPEM